MVRVAKMMSAEAWGDHERRADGCKKLNTYKGGCRMSLTFRFDHAVCVARDPFQSLKDAEAVGLSAAAGGRHEKWGTYNSLLHFGLSYIEFLGLEDRNRAAAVADNSLIRQMVREQPSGEGLIRLALRTNQMEDAARHFQRQGLRVTGPIPGRRATPDGQILEWSMLFIEETGEDPFFLPFIIDWKQTDEEREHRLRQLGLLKNKGRVAEIATVTRDAEKAAATWKRLFGATIEKPAVDERLNARMIPVSLAGVRFAFYEPTGVGPVSDLLSARGQRPFRIVIEDSGLKTARRLAGAEMWFR